MQSYTVKMNSSQYRKLPRHYIDHSTFLLQLGQTQAQTLAFLLPKGCTLAPSRSKPKQQYKRPRQQQNCNMNVHNSMIQNQSSSVKNHSLSRQPVSSKVLQKAPTKRQVKQQVAQNMKPCLNILQQLKNYKQSWPFRQPVDPDVLGIPQYYEIIAQPMDLQTVQTKFKAAAYKAPQQFYRDINLIIKNSYVFNEPNQEFIKLTNDFEKYFFRIAGAQARPTVDKKLEKQKQREKEKLERERLKEQKVKEKLLQKQRERQRKLMFQQQQQAQMALKLAKKKKKFIPKDLLQAQNIGTQEKHELASNIHNLLKQHLRGIRQIVFDSSKTDQPQCLLLSQNQFDIQKIGYKKIRQLQKYVRIKLAQIQNNKFNSQSMDKKEQIDLDQLQSEWTEEFVD